MDIIQNSKMSNATKFDLRKLWNYNIMCLIEVTFFISFNNISMIMFGFFHFPVKLIPKQVYTWPLIPTPFDMK